MAYPSKSGPLTGSVFGLVRLLAESPSFQRKTGVSNQIEAEQHIYRWQFRESPLLLNAARPFAAVWPSFEMDFEQFAGGSANWLSGKGALTLYLTDNDRHPKEDRHKSGDEFAAWLDAVVYNDVKKKFAVDDHLDGTGITILRPPIHNREWDTTSQGNYWDAMFLIHWGRDVFEALRAR